MEKNGPWTALAEEELADTMGKAVRVSERTVCDPFFKIRHGWLRGYVVTPRNHVTKLP